MYIAGGNYPLYPHCTQHLYSEILNHAISCERSHQDLRGESARIANWKSLYRRGGISGKEKKKKWSRDTAQSRYIYTNEGK